VGTDRKGLKRRVKIKIDCQYMHNHQSPKKPPEVAMYLKESLVSGVIHDLTDRLPGRKTAAG
jgi:hypothetical protein